jgi:hypothetical protein
MDSHQREKATRKLLELTKDPEVASIAHGLFSERQDDIKISKSPSELKSPQRNQDAFNFFAFASGLAAWCWSVIAPDSSPVFGSLLFALAVGFILLAVFKRWRMHPAVATVVLLTAISVAAEVDWLLILKPQRGKPFKMLLEDGYHLTSECMNVSGTAEMPDWMRDQSTAWQSRVEQMIEQKLDYKDLQLWNGAIIIGRVTDKNNVAYQCTWLGNKVGALEQVVAEKYDPSLKHRDYKGPTYWFSPVDGKVDISDALNDATKHGGTTNIVINSAGSASKK